MAGFAKLFSSITESSVWCESHSTLRVWIAMLARADAEGYVEGSTPGFASLCRITREEMEGAVAKLSVPDPDSRSKEFEGRRIEAFDGGWKILNYAKYRNQGQKKEGSRAPYFREYRAIQRRRLQTEEDIRAQRADSTLRCPDCTQYPCVCGEGVGP